MTTQPESHPKIPGNASDRMMSLAFPRFNRDIELGKQVVRNESSPAMANKEPARVTKKERWTLKGGRITEQSRIAP